jgi:HPt (histidine-containing phosphotransfer) domain-containing protein
MDDHVAKPFRRSQLRATVDKWVGSSTVDATAPPVASATERQRLSRIDRRALLERLKVGGRVRPALVAKVIALFLADTPPILKELALSLKRDDQRAVERAVHTLKSSADSVGALALSELAGLAEGHARRGSLDAVREHVSELNGLFDAAVAQLEALRAELLLSQADAVES